MHVQESIKFQTVATKCKLDANFWIVGVVHYTTIDYLD